MEKIENKAIVKPTKPYIIRKLARSGNSRYLSVGTILPTDWEAVKVVVTDMSKNGCILLVTPIR